MREMDLILGRFADAWIGRLTETELDEYERLLEIPDGELLVWIIGERQIPSGYDTMLIERMRRFHRGGSVAC